MSDPISRFEEIVKRLKEKGYRLTPQRLAVAKILSMSDEHPGAEEIYRKVKGRFPSTSLATIYKTVHLLKEMGEVMELGFPNDTHRYDGARSHPHPHLICTKCRKIIDVDVPALSGVSEQLAQKTGYQVVHHRLDFFGLCPNCQRRKRRACLTDRKSL